MPTLSQTVLDRATTLHKDFQSQVQEVRDNTDLTTEGKIRQLGRLYTRAVKDMRDIRKGWTDDAQQVSEDLTKRIFGAMNSSGADAVSARDADDRAASLSDANEARRLLARALNNGDTVLARAIALRAFVELSSNVLTLGGGDWQNVLDDYAAANPTVADQLLQLADANAQSRQQRIQASMTFSIVRPIELAGIRLQDLDDDGDAA